MVRDLNEVEICLYTHEFMFVYDLYKSHNKNYEVTLEDITMIASNNYNKENYHKILLEVIGIDNYKDEIINNVIKKNNIKISLDNHKYTKKLISIYKENYNNYIRYNIINEIFKKSLIIIIKSGRINKHLVKFNDIDINFNDLNRITEKDYKDEICLICLENLNSFKSFRIFSCCFSNTCINCYKANECKCPICNQYSKTLISY